MRVFFSYDQAGAQLAALLALHATGLGHDVTDLGQSADPVEAAEAASASVLTHPKSVAIVVDAYGQASYITACKTKGIVACVASDERTAWMTREHNDCRVLCIGAAITGPALATAVVERFLAGSYAGGRHQIRVDMLARLA